MSKTQTGQKTPKKSAPKKITQAKIIPSAADKLAADLEARTIQRAVGEVMPPENRDHELVPATDTPPPAAQENTDSREAVLSIVGGVTTEQLSQALTIQTEQRQLIKKFIKDNLENGIDYGRIHVVKGCPTEKAQPGSCDREYHYSKSILMKPGQEKIFSLFSITDEIEKDVDAYEMLPGVHGLVAYKCIMYRGDKRIGEGRGAATLDGERSDPNSTIKKAEKRARMDACLSLGFSAYFTQDLDDPDYKSQREMMNAKAAAEAERRDKDDLGLWIRKPEDPIDDDERKLLFAWIKKVGYTDPDVMLELLEANGIGDPKKMKSGESRAFIRALKSGEYVPIAVRPAAAETPPADGMGAEPAPVMQSALEEPELVVDDDFKQNVQKQFESLGLNARGVMWFRKHSIGKPYGDSTKYTDQDWRKIFRLLEDVVEGRVQVPDEYIAGVIDDTSQVPPAIAETFDGAVILDPAQPGGGH